MQIQINTDRNVQDSDTFSSHVKSIVEEALSRFSEHITRIEVHLSDENSDKAGIDDKRCVIEARLKGRQPIAVTDQAINLDQAIRGATEKLSRMIENILGRLDSR
ncbi:HPF/RaiA family ribosome-associated protein [Nitrosomonas sp.]|uniref:HPF/RaiA family ribosome-associated protein n=1 Tax=Nitrosomonas sp. TaxID=42353 RepID=UPI0026054FDD|nr:HPF/RaiA family ribosome-associated protein [Nitrosomonas sp.]MCW5598583.1 HPF/RaiA family ribosome-associated protein [Nitrosomonas sp.]MCW5602263.1 HPF/RaiA family ribosome-associated protein [Nitrosomonas sp.]